MLEEVVYWDDVIKRMIESDTWKGKKVLKREVLNHAVFL